MKKPSAFITGIAGFAGSFLAEELLAEGFKVAGNLYDGEPTKNIDAIKSDLRLYPLDICNAAQSRKLLKQVKPDYVFHLAALASVGRSFKEDRLTYQINFEGTLNILDAAREIGNLKSLLFTSSCDTYGIFRPKNKTMTEAQPLNPVSPYGISKVAAEHACRYYQHQYGLPVIVTRAFNHSGPRQADSFVIPAFASQVAAIEAGRQKPVLSVGDLSARRDLSDVRDIVAGYRLAATHGTPREVYQLCTGKAVPIQKVVDILIALSSRKIRLKIDKNRLRKSDIPLLRGDCSKAKKKLGYITKYGLQTTLTDTLNYWRARYGVKPATKKL